MDTCREEIAYGQYRPSETWGTVHSG